MTKYISIRKNELFGLNYDLFFILVETNPAIFDLVDINYLLNNGNVVSYYERDKHYCGGYGNIKRIEGYFNSLRNAVRMVKNKWPAAKEIPNKTLI